MRSVEVTALCFQDHMASNVGLPMVEIYKVEQR